MESSLVADPGAGKIADRMADKGKFPASDKDVSAVILFSTWRNSPGLTIRFFIYTICKSPGSKASSDYTQPV